MDRVVSTVCFEGSVYIFTGDGEVFEMKKDTLTGQVEFHYVGRIQLSS